MTARIFQFTERTESRELSTDAGTFTLRYTASGETNDDLVAAYALSVVPPFYATQVGILKRRDVRVIERGFALYDVDVDYGRVDKTAGSISFDFDTGGATINIKAAREHVASYPAGDDDDPHHGAINVDKEGHVEGVDVIIPALRFTYRFRHPLGVVTELYAQSLARATGRVNANPWRIFAAGEALFAGATGSDGTDADAEVSYTIIASENRNDLSVGDITGIVKQGHHLAWIEFADSVDDDGRAASPPRRVHIERVYDTIDFATALGF